MTKFMTLPKMEVKPELKKTVLTHYVNSEKEIIKDDDISIDKYEYVLHIGTDKSYGDVFKCWSDENDFLICFGTKGGEFE